MKPLQHAQSSVQHFGGKVDDYLEIHEFLDSSKAVFPDSRHRALTHTTWFITQVLPRVFGSVRTNSEGIEYSVREIGEQHVLEDYDMQFIPTPQDFLAEIPFTDWIDNARKGAVPPSRKKLEGKEKRLPTERTSLLDPVEPSRMTRPPVSDLPDRRCGPGMID